MSALNNRMVMRNYRLPALIETAVVHVYLEREGAPGGRPATGLTGEHAYQACYLPPGEARARSFALAGAQVDPGHCGFCELDRRLLPGLYSLAIPASLRQPGFTVVYIKFEGVRAYYLQLHGVCYDPYERFAMSLGTWVRSNCHENLTSGIRQSLPITLRPILAGAEYSEINHGTHNPQTGLQCPGTAIPAGHCRG